jgi:hypothetical protein
LLNNDPITATDFLGLVKKEFDLVAKSWIAPITRVGIIVDKAGHNYHDDLKNFARFLNNLSGSIHPTPASSFRDGRYRLYSEVALTASFDEETCKLTVTPTKYLIDGGRELLVIPTSMRASRLRIEDVSDEAVRFAYVVAGRPNVLADADWLATFIDIIPFLSVSFADVLWRHPNYRYIHHKVSGTISRGNGNLEIGAQLDGSKFPSHRLFINGKVEATIPQGALSELWYLDSIDNILRN